MQKTRPSKHSERTRHRFFVAAPSIGPSRGIFNRECGWRTVGAQSLGALCDGKRDRFLPVVRSGQEEGRRSIIGSG